MSDADDSTRTWTLLELLRWSTAFFDKHAIDTPRLDAEILIGHVLGMSRLELLTGYDRPVSADELAIYKKLVIRRARNREPIAYLVGEREFWSLALEVSPAVLVPRPETERLVELAVERLRQRSAPTLVDVGTGSGAIALALAVELPGARILATDLSEEALAVARRNAARHDLEARVRFLRGDLLEALRDTDLRGQLDAIVSNPPYVAEHEMAGLAPELGHEPRSALAAGPEGLDVIERLCREAAVWLAPGGWLLCEIGSAQRAGASALFDAAGLAEVECIKDYSGHDRVVVGKRPG